MNSIKLYEKGHSLAYMMNYEAAYDYFIEAAHLGNARAIKDLGIFYLYGRGVPQSYEKAFHYLRIAYDICGKIWAAYEVSDCLNEIRTCEEGRSAYREYLDYLVGRDDLEAFVYKVMECLDGGVYPRDVTEAIRLCELLIERGESFGAELLGEMYCEGKYVEQDYEKAYRYLNATEDSRAFLKKYILGVMYLDGLYIEQDTSKAIDYFKSIVDSDSFMKEEDYYYHEAKSRLVEIEAGEVS